MDLRRIFKRQKSAGKKEKTPEVKQAIQATNLGSESLQDKPCDVNLNSKVDKSGKSWRKSLRKSLKKRKSFQSNSCDDILHQDPRTIGFLESKLTTASEIPHNTKRWSYSPGHTEQNSFYPADVHNSVLSRRNTEGLLTMNIGRPSSFSGNGIMSSFSVLFADQGMLPNSGIGEFGRPVSHPPAQLGHEVKTANKARDARELLPHSTLFERAAEVAFDRMSEKQTSDQSNLYTKEQSDEGFPFPPPPDDHEFSHTTTTDKKEVETGDDLSWGSNEFDSDSGEESVAFDSQTHEETGKVQIEKRFFKRNRELSKDITDGMKSFLQRKGVTSKKHIRSDHDEDVDTFIDVRLSRTRQAGPHLKPPPTGLLPHQSHRRNIIETIISSESSYIDSLERLEISYRKMLLESKPAIISPELVEKIFYKIADILQCHQLFQIALTAAVCDWDEHEKIGDTFVASFSKSIVLECYSSYINNFMTAMELVRKTCKQKPQFLAFLRERQDESQNHLNLYGLMLKPVQRFPQFIMLVQDLLKNTPANHDDRLPLQLALTELETLAENLNQRRADDEEKTEMIRLLESSNIKLTSNLTKDGRMRRLLKQGLVREITYSGDGTIDKDRECLLVLTNDMLLSCSCTNRRQQVKTSMSTFRDLYKLKWCTTLDFLNIVDQQEMLVTEDQIKMKSDIVTLRSICELVEKLHYPISGLTVEQLQSQASAIEAKTKQPNFSKPYNTDNAFTIHFPQKSGDFKRTLVMPDRQLHNEWLDGVINAKLANDPKNLHCWFSADGSDPEYLWKPPLFLESVNCLDDRRTLQVQCAYAFMPANHVTLLWLACSASTVVATVNIYRIVDEKTEKVHVMQVESSVQCMEHWSPYYSPSVWLGMECGSLIEFGIGSSFSKLYEVAMPTLSTVMIMKAFEKNLYAGLLDGSLVMYTRPEGHKGLVHVRSITVGSGPLNCLSPLNDKLWGASGNDIVTINLENFEVESTRTVQAEQTLTVSHVIQVGSGFWVAFCDTCSLHLYHLDSLQLLQDLNLSRAIRDFFQGLGWHSRVNEKCSITSMWSSYWQLLVGTSSGLVLTMPLPKLSGSVPKITGPCRICYHMLNGPVTFLCAPEMAAVNRMSCASETAEEEGERPPEVPERSPVKAVNNTFQHNEAFAHKRTSSEGLLNISDTLTILSSSKTTEKRFSSVEPYNKAQNSVEEFNKLLIPPALPPKPGAPKKDEIAAEEMPEDDFLFTNSNVEQLSSPTQTMERNESVGKSRNFPVLLACGDGYRYRGVDDTDHEMSASQKATTILSWKIVP